MKSKSISNQILGNPGKNPSAILGNPHKIIGNPRKSYRNPRTSFVVPRSSPSGGPWGGGGAALAWPAPLSRRPWGPRPLPGCSQGTPQGPYEGPREEKGLENHDFWKISFKVLSLGSSKPPEWDSECEVTLCVERTGGKHAG